MQGLAHEGLGHVSDAIGCNEEALRSLTIMEKTLREFNAYMLNFQVSKPKG